MFRTRTPRRIKQQESGYLQLDAEVLENRMMLSTVSIQAFGETGQESIEVSVAGQTVLTQDNVSTQGEVITFETDDNFDIGDLQISFTNDLFDPANDFDRNLVIQKVVFDGEEFFADDPSVFSTGTYLAADGVSPGFGRGNTLHANGFFQFATPESGGSTIIVNAAGNEGGEQFILLAGDEEFGPQTVSQSLTAFTFQTDDVVDPASIQVLFINDLYDPANDFDRNLTVDNIVLDGVTFEAEDPSVLVSGFFDGSKLATGNFETETIQGNGSFQFAGTEEVGSFNADTSFGGDGFIALEFGVFTQTAFSTSDDGVTIAHLSELIDGSGNTSNELHLVDANGSRVTSFGDGGIVDLQPILFPLLEGDGTSTLNIEGVELDSQGRAVIAGFHFPVGFGPRENFLIRLNADGTLDSSFALVGPEAPELLGFGDQILVDDLDRILVGNAEQITRLNSDGSTDTSFGNNGVTTFDVAPDLFPSLGEFQLDSDGSIVVLLDTSGFGSPFAATLTRLDTNGQFDTSFGEQGTVEIFDSSADSIIEFFEDFAIDDQGRIVVGGSSTVTRFTADGQLDTSFGDNGVAFVPDSLVENGETESFFFLGDLAIDNQGRIVVASNPGVIVFNSNGNLDLTFDDNGFQDIPFNIINTVDFDDSGRLVLTGTRADVFGSDFSAAVVTRFEFS